jgi:hypothetical protein
MRDAITQKVEYGCGVACFAFAANITYDEAAHFLGLEQASSDRFWIKDFVTALNRFGLQYEAKYVKPHIRRLIYIEGAIVLIHRSKTYKSGHYLIRHNGQWMDPWINLPKSYDIRKATSGYRARLPGKPMYVLLPKGSK